MVVEFINFWSCYWILAYGSLTGNVMIAGSILAGIGAWAKLAFP